jgi:hypothetical protein
VTVAGQDRRDLIVAVMGGEAADQLDGVLGQPTPLRAAGVEAHGQFGAGAALPADLDVGAPVGGLDGDDHVADERAQQLLAVAVGRRRRVPQPRQIARQPRESGPFVVGQRRGPSLLERGELAALALDGRERVLERSFEGARDEPVLGLARVELASRAIGLELGALDGEALAGEPLVVLVMQLSDGPGGRGNASWCHGLQERGGDGLVEAAAAERLAGWSVAWSTCPRRHA